MDETPGLPKAAFGTGGQREVSTYQLFLVRSWVFCVAIGIEEELGVAVDGDEGLDVPVTLHKVHDGLDLHFGIGGLAMVSLRAGVVAGSCHCRRREVAVSVPYSRAVWLPQLPILCMELGERWHAEGSLHHPQIKERPAVFYNLGVPPPSPARLGQVRRAPQARSVLAVKWSQRKGAGVTLENP